MNTKLSFSINYNFLERKTHELKVLHFVHIRNRYNIRPCLIQQNNIWCILHGAVKKSQTSDFTATWQIQYFVYPNLSTATNDNDNSLSCSGQGAITLRYQLNNGLRTITSDDCPSYCNCLLFNISEWQNMYLQELKRFTLMSLELFRWLLLLCI